jgi:hypothetical protein
MIINNVAIIRDLIDCVIDYKKYHLLLIPPLVVDVVDPADEP